MMTILNYFIIYIFCLSKCGEAIVLHCKMVQQLRMPMQLEVIDSKEASNALSTSMNAHGTRESHVHVMLQKIEASIKECVQSNKDC